MFDPRALEARLRTLLHEPPQPLFHPVAERAFLVEFREEDETIANGRTRAAYEKLASANLEGAELVPAARSLLVSFESPGFGGHQVAPATQPTAHDIPITPDGIDLPDVLQATALESQEFWHLMTETLFTVGFLGFSPGFAYLYGLPKRLRLPRRASPRPRVRAGSLALGGPYAGLYPQAMPGGWNLVGTTQVPLFDVTREPPALFSPGDTVRFCLAG